MSTTQFTFIAILLFAVLVLLALLLFQYSKGRAQNVSAERIEDLQDELVRIGEQVQTTARTTAEYNAQLRSEVNTALRDGLSEQSRQQREMSIIVSEQMLSASRNQTDSLLKLQDSVTRTLTESMDRLQSSNEEKLDQIRGVVDEKLDKTLNERLDTNFKMVGDQLGLLYKSLGELQALSSGVSDLNRTLANVKTRGVWGEVQLGRILEQTMTKSQYAVNVVTKPNSDDRVEYAVLFPAQDGSGEQVYLPIDAKFPSDIYNRIIEAGESGDAKAVAAVNQELKVRILDEARTIRDKYLSPPHTTNYGIMFLPTEGLYAEVLRIDGLTEKCQQIGVIVAGPTTITAILNSLQAGFRNVALSKKSFEVMKLLEAVKTQFAKLDDEVERTQKKLSDATKSTDRLRHRTELIQRRMRNVTELDSAEARRLLDLESEDSDTSTFD
ncbi:MAG: DNA recombination protein RmuC [Lachnospiraceae bacterium]|nr:DNA recombination protein RmuC [Lachnospiraceae bacterium]